MTSFAHTLPFDPAYGYDLAGLLAIEPPAGPVDLVDFWETTYAEAQEIAPRPVRQPSAFSMPGGEVYEVYFDSWRKRRIGAWVVEPPGARQDRAIVVGHGYGGREAPALEMAFAEDYVQIFPCAPGFHLSPAAGVPHNNAGLHVINGLASREQYVIRDCVASLWCTVSAVLAMYPRVTEVVYYGESFGGGLGALALPWEARIVRGILVVPTFGHHPLRLQCECQGSGEAVRSYQKHRGDVMPVLQYFDAATVASLTTIPVLTAPACFDPAVPPPGQFAVANAIRSAGSETCVREAGHFGEYAAWPEDQARFVAAARQLLAAR